MTLMLFMYITTAVFGLFVNRKYLLLNPIVFVIILSSFEFAGFASLATENNPVDNVYMLMALTFISLMVLGNFMYLLLKPIPQSSRKINFSNAARSSNSLILFLCMVSIVSLALSLFYYNLVGRNLFIQALASPYAISDDIAGDRLSFYSGETQYYPGFFNQFKNFLLPISALSLITIGIIEKRKKTLYFGTVMIIASIPMLLGTGQRTFLLLTALAFAPVVSVLSKKSLLIKLSGALSVVVILLLFGFLSTVLGRSEQSDLIGALQSMYVRLTLQQSLGTWIGFKHYYPGPTGGLEADWFNSVLKLIPGATADKGIAHEVNLLSFGTDRGTSPMSIWASIWFNLGFLGGGVFCFFWGWFLGYITKAIRSGPHHAARITAWSGCVVSVGMWFQGDPTVLVQTGFFAGLIMIFCMNVISRKYYTPKKRLRYEILKADAK